MLLLLGLVRAGIVEHALADEKVASPHLVRNRRKIHGVCDEREFAPAPAFPHHVVGIDDGAVLALNRLAALEPAPERPPRNSKLQCLVRVEFTRAVKLLKRVADAGLRVLKRKRPHIKAVALVDDARSRYFLDDDGIVYVHVEYFP